MTFKTITIKKSAYEKLIAMKHENESFSDLFERLSKNNIDSIKKLRGTIEFREKTSMMKEIYNRRREKRYG